MTISISAALKAHLASQYQTLCTIIRVARVDGTVLGFTDHDQDIVYDDGSGSVTYQAAVSYITSDSASGSAMQVDNAEYDGVLTSPSITEADLQAGLWDYAGVRVSIINWADLTMGGLRVPGWKLGEITSKRGQFVAEIRGIMQAYSTTLGELTQPGCRANLGDARCKVVLIGGSPSFTVTGTLTGVDAGSDQVVMRDTARTEPGPAGGVLITAISKSNPGHVTLASGATFRTGEPITISGCVAGDFATLNANTVIRNLSGNVFDLAIDTSAFSGSYTANSGTVTPLGGASGYFDFGIMTMTSGLSNGFRSDVLSYVPGQWTLQLPFPYTVAIGDTYSMVAGCDKSISTCINRFGNAVNFRGEPYLPGIDKIIQVGKQ